MGFGLGPTLEAYSLLSKELQKNGLELWRTDESFDSTKGYSLFSSHSINCLFPTDKDAPLSGYVDSRNGLYPAPLGRNAKASTVTKVRQKLKFLGKFMAKALMDSRMVSPSFRFSICILHSFP